jgi:hypothetical protein
MADMRTRMSARIGHPSAKARLLEQLANDPPPPSKPIRCVPMLNCVIIDVPPLGSNQYGHVYVVGFADYVKIGWSENVKRRLFDLQKHAPEKLVLYSLFAANLQTERKLHRRFKRVRLNGEWFALSHGLKDWVRDGCPMELMSIAPLC